jgi:predicted ABC-type ATPase
LIFLWLDNIELAIQRVKIRVSEGGHDIPENIIRRRYKSGLVNLINKYIPLSDYWIIVNNSEGRLNLIAEGLKNNEIEIKDLNSWKTIKKQANE